MKQYITQIRTEQGDMQIDYNALANLPKINGEKLVGDIVPENIGAASVKHTHSYSDIGAFPKILTSEEYGPECPKDNLFEGRLFFKRVEG